jgi:predicted porin
VTAKYVVDRLKLYAGYEWIQFAPPSDRVTSLTDESGNFLCNSASFDNSPACLIGGLPTVINVANFDFGDKIQQTVWTGFRYSFTPQLDFAGAYYHADFSAFGAAAGAANGFVAGAVPEVCATNPRASGNCHGTADTVSFLLDWQFAPKWDTYLGTQYTKLNGSQANGFFVDNNWSTTAGIRFRW